MTALVRTIRRQRGLTLQGLAEQTGLTKSYLSKVEREQATPSIAAALKIADALQVDVARLFSAQNTGGQIAVDRTGGAQRYRALAPEMLGKAMSPFVVRPGDGSADDPHPAHSGQELVFVRAGTIELAYGADTVILGPGDSAYFDASVDHRIRAVGDEPAEALVVAYHEPGPR